MTSSSSTPRLRLAAAAAVVFFALFLIDFGESRHFWELAADSVHVPIFAFTVLGLFWFFSVIPNPLLWSVLVSVFLVVFIELIQPAFGRSESVVDMENGFIGSACGVAGIFLWRKLGSKACVPFSLIVAAGMIYAFVPAYKEWHLVTARTERLPVIADFEGPEELEFWDSLADDPPYETYYLSALRPHSGASALKVNTVPLHYSGVELRLEGMNWTPYSALEFSAYVDSAQVLDVRVDDWENCDTFDSRFNRSFQLSAGWNTVRIPIDDIRHGPQRRELHVEDLKRMLFFLEPAQVSHSFALDDIILSK